MSKVTVTMHQDYIEEVITTLYETGMVEIIDIVNDAQSFNDESTDRALQGQGFDASYELRITRIIDILMKSNKPLKGIRTLLHPQLPEVTAVKKCSLKELYSSCEHLFQEIEPNILTCEKQLNFLDERKVILLQQQEQLAYFKNMKITLSDVNDSPSVLVRVGKTTDLASFERDLEKTELILLQSEPFTIEKKKEWAILLVAHRSEQEHVEKISRDYLTLFSLPLTDESPRQAIQTLTNTLKQLDEEKHQILSQLRSLVEKHLQMLLVLREQLRLEHVRTEVCKNFGKTQFTYRIRGWVLEKDANKLNDNLYESSNDHVYCSFETPSPNPDYPPTYIETPRWGSLFKTFVDLFSTPKYNELNPTLFIGIFFILFFSIMLGDAGYGLAILLLSVFGYVKFRKFSPTIRDWSFLGIFLGVSTIIAGLLMNSFFGDFIPRFIYQNPEQPLYSATILGIHFPIDALGDPLTVLTIALCCGLIHLNLGIFLGLIQSLKQHDYKTFITQRFCWIPLQIGGGILIGNMILDWQTPTSLFYLGGALTLIGIILLFISSGPVGFFGITGFVGDWLSYARLLALGLSTSGMALAFNVIGDIISGMIPVIGLVILPIFLVIAHTANLAIQSLGAGVHSLRLQYVEFFNRFYEGGGREFAPFHVRRIYTKIEGIKTGGKR
jgi:V/A-type H+-transporting ATPase subunit I